MTIDESLISYEPKQEAKNKAIAKGEPIPLMYIPRKPHPNGLLIYQLVTFVENPLSNEKFLPFIVDMIPYLEAKDVSPTGALKTFFQR